MEISFLTASLYLFFCAGLGEEKTTKTSKNVDVSTTT